MKKNYVLKKIRKINRLTRVKAFEMFWDEIAVMNLWKRIELCWVLLLFKQKPTQMVIRTRNGNE